MSFRRYLARTSQFLQGNRTSRRTNKHRQQSRLIFIRPHLEYLEDRIVLNGGGDYLLQLHNAAGTVNTIASGLESGPLSKGLPIITGSSSSTNTLSQILSVNTTFTGISDALNKISTDPNTSQSDLQKELPTGFQINEYDNNGISITYTQDISGEKPQLQIAQNVSDFFGANQQNRYFSNIDGLLKGSAVGIAQVTTGGFSITFGVDNQGFFLDNNKSTPLFSGSFTAQATLSGQVNIRNFAFDVSVDGQGTINLDNINLSLGTTRIHSFDPQTILNDIHLTYDTSNSGATIKGQFSANVFGTPLVTWGAIGNQAPAIVSWSFASDGTLQQAKVNVPPSGIGAPGGLDQKALQSVLAKSVENALGLSKYNVPLDPLGGLPPEFQEIIATLTPVLQGGLDDPNNIDPNNDPQQELNQAAEKTVQPSYVVSARDLANILMGNPGDLIRFEPHTDLPNYSLNNIELPSFIISLAGILNFTFEGGIDFNINGNAGLGFGIDTSGVFVETDPTITHLKYSMSVGAHIGVTGDVLDLVNIIKGQLGPTLTTTATLTLNNSSPDGKIHLSNSNSLSDLGSWLQDHLNLHIDVDGSIDLDVTAFSPQGGLQDKIKSFSPEAAQALGPIVKGFGDVADFFSGAAEDLCQQAKNTPFDGIASAVSGGNCDNVKKATEIAFGQFAPYLVQYALQDLGAKEYDASGNLRTYVDNASNAHLFWSWILVHYAKDFGPSQILSGTSSANSGNNTNVQSGRNDFIAYRVNGSTLNIIGQAGTDNIRIVDLGNDNIELFRSGIDSQGTSHTDLPVIFTGITLINATMNDSAGSQSSFIMDSSLSISSSVTSGAGDDTIITGGGDDTIHGGSGKDYLKSTGGTNQIYAGSGDSILMGGSGSDSLYGGNGNDILQAGSGKEYLEGGAGNDILAAFNDPTTPSGTDTLYGGGGNDKLHGGGNDKLYGGSGTSILYGTGPSGEGSSDDQDSFYGGSGTVTMYGGLGDNTYFAGSGTTVVHGGPASDEINWQVGDGDMTIDGGVDPADSNSLDVLQLEGSNGADGPDSYTVSKSGNGISIAAPGATLTASSIQSLNIDDGLRGANNTVVNDLTGTSVVLVEINFSEVANPDGVLDSTTLNVADGNKTINVGEVTGSNEVNDQTGPIMYVTGAVGPVVLLANQDDSLTVNGGKSVNQFNMLAASGTTTINTQGGQNTINVGSNAPAINGILTGIQGALTINGSTGSDTANVDDTGAAANRSGTLTPTTLTGLGMGPSGISFSGLNKLNLNVGQGASAADTFNITEVNTPSLVTGPTYAFATQIPAGRLLVSGNIGSVHVDTGTPGSFAGPVATATMYEGYSPWTLQEFYTPPASFSPPPAGTLPSNNPTPPGSSDLGAGQPVDAVPDPANAPSAPAVGVSSAAGVGAVPTAFVASAGGSPPAAPPTAQPSLFTLFFDLYEMELNLFEMELSWLQTLVNLKGLPLP